MLEKHLRHHYQKWLVNKFADKIGRRISPNSITITSIILGILSAISLVLHHTYLALIVLLLSGYLDTLDGTVARLNTKTSPFGSGLDIVGDRIVEFAIILGLYFVDPEARATTVILMLGSMLFCISSFLVVGVFTTNISEKSFHYSSGLMERLETFIFFIAMFLLPQYFNYLGNAFTLLVTFTALFRMYEFYRQKYDT
jgi:phosphatidylglycerophosphate synthase